MTADELKERGRELLSDCQYEQAIPLLKAAAEASPQDEVLWEELISAASCIDQHEQAVEFCRQAIGEHPRSDWLWRQLGNELMSICRFDEAETALNFAHRLNPDSEWLWRDYVMLYKHRQNLEKEIEAWERLHKLGVTNASDLNSLGVAYHRHKNFARALECYRLAAGSELSVVPLFNMGMVFNDPEIAQDIDAADAYRRVLAIDPTYQVAMDHLEATKLKLIPLAGRVRAMTVELLQPADNFQFYLNPFEVFQLDDLESLDHLDVKTIQRAKKRLLQEIELNDGRVCWLGDFPLDQSRAIALEDELYDEHRKRYHWAVFRNKRLLRFLTTGELDHFLYSDDYFPFETLELLEKDPGFRSFLSKPFALQYNFVLSRAIERRLMTYVDAMFDGRRWVLPEDDDVCFEGAYKRANEILEATRAKADEGCQRKVEFSEIEDFLHDHLLPDLFNLLPTAFASIQRELVAAIRSLGIACFNEHGDTDLAKTVLNLCRLFTSRSIELTRRLEEDLEAIERLIAEERKYEAYVEFGAYHPFHITKAGVRDGTSFFHVRSVKEMRWGMDESSDSTTYEIIIRNDGGETIRTTWQADAADAERQTSLFSSIITAMLHYVAPVVVEKMSKGMMARRRFTIGPCSLSRQGVGFETRALLRKKSCMIPWQELAITTNGDEITLTSTADSGDSISMSVRETFNAVLWPLILIAMQQELALAAPAETYGV